MPKLEPKGILGRLERDRRDRELLERRQAVLDRLGGLTPGIDRLRRTVRGFEEVVGHVEETATRVQQGQDGIFEVDEALEELWHCVNAMQTRARELGSVALPADQRPGPGE